MEKNLKMKNILKLIEEFERWSPNLLYRDVVLLQMIQNLNNRILELEHEAFTRNLDNGKNERNSFGDPKGISKS
jgi:predicted Zn-dependent protease